MQGCHFEKGYRAFSAMAYYARRKQTRVIAILLAFMTPPLGQAICTNTASLLQHDDLCHAQHTWPDPRPFNAVTQNFCSASISLPRAPETNCILLVLAIGYQRLGTVDEDQRQRPVNLITG